MTAADRERIEEMYLDGALLIEIAAATGFSDSSISAKLIEWDLRDPRPRINPEQAQKAAEWYSRGVSANRIARQFGFSESAIYAALKRNGVEARQRPLTDVEKARIEAMWAERQNISWIAEELGRNRATVRQWLIRRGLWYEREWVPRRERVDRHPWNPRIRQGEKRERVG